MLESEPSHGALFVKRVHGAAHLARFALDDGDQDGKRLRGRRATRNEFQRMALPLKKQLRACAFRYVAQSHDVEWRAIEDGTPHARVDGNEQSVRAPCHAPFGVHHRRKGRSRFGERLEAGRERYVPFGGEQREHRAADERFLLVAKQPLDRIVHHGDGELLVERDQPIARGIDDCLETCALLALLVEAPKSQGAIGRVGTKTRENHRKNEDSRFQHEFLSQRNQRV